MLCCVVLGFGSGWVDERFAFAIVIAVHRQPTQPCTPHAHTVHTPGPEPYSMAKVEPFAAYVLDFEEVYLSLR